MSPLPTTHVPFIAEQIDNIQDKQIISTRDGGCKRQLVHWKIHPESDDVWITREDMQLLTPDLLGVLREPLRTLLDMIEFFLLRES